MKIKALEFVNDKNETVSVYVAYISDPYSDSQDRNYWKIEDITVKGFRKHKAISVLYSARDDHNYRNMKFNSSDRENYIKQKCLEYLTEEQLCQAVDFAWQMIKPIKEEIRFSSL